MYCNRSVGLPSKHHSDWHEIIFPLLIFTTMGRWFHVSQNDVYWEDPHFYYNTWSIFTTMGRWFHVSQNDVYWEYWSCIVIEVWVFPINIILTDMKSSSHCCKYWSCIVIEVWVFPVNIILTDMKSSAPIRRSFQDSQRDTHWYYISTLFKPMDEELLVLAWKTHTCITIHDDIIIVLMIRPSDLKWSSLVSTISNL
jgi:hypothetical protein